MTTMPRPLDQIAHEVKVRFSKVREYTTRADEARDALLVKANDHRIAAGLLLIEAHTRVKAGEAGNITWGAWIEANVPRSRRDVDRVMKLAGSSDPEAALEIEREDSRERKRRYRQDETDNSDVRPISPDEGVEYSPADALAAVQAAVKNLPKEQFTEFKAWFRAFCGEQPVKAGAAP